MSIIELQLDLFRSVLTSAHSALKAIMVINGGAALALLTLIGNMMTKDMDSRILLLSRSIELFCYGLLAAVIAAGLTYGAQFCFLNALQLKVRWLYPAGIIVQIVTIIVVITSYILFILGVDHSIETFNYFRIYI